MKKLASLITITALTFSLAAGSFAAETKTAVDKTADTTKKAADNTAEKAKDTVEKVTGEAKDPAKPVSYRGDVATVDASAKTFTFKNKDGKERVFSVGAESKITKDGQPADFSAITVGAYATGSYKKASDGKFEVVKVSIGPKPEKKPKAEAEAKPAEVKPADKKAE